jgi:predicted site-specific integrase-resolvase
MKHPSGVLVGYARTSTADQKAGLDAQIAELKAAGCTKIFSEHTSGVDADRPQLREALSYLREGDGLAATRPCRLARSTMDLLNIVGDIVVGDTHAFRVTRLARRPNWAREKIVRHPGSCT